MLKPVLFVPFLCVLLVQNGDAATDKVVCYYTSWSEYEGDGHFGIDEIDVTKCTHVNYAFAGLNEDGTIRVADDVIDIEQKGYMRINELKKSNPKLKVLISVGGGSSSSATFSQVAADTLKKYNFVKSAYNYTKDYGFDGIDVHWDVPGGDGGSADDKANFVDLLWILRSGLASHNLLTVAVISNSSDYSYDVSEICEVADFVNVMTYDMRSPDDGRTGQNAPLYGSSVTGDNNCVDTAITNWLEKGADPQKLVLGLAFFGRSFTLSDPNKHGLGAPTTGPGKAGPITNDTGCLGYLEICTNDWEEVWDDEQQVPYRFKGDQWVGFDDERSIAAKVDYAKSKNLGGVMIWTITTDDHHANCGNKNGLLTTVVQNL